MNLYPRDEDDEMKKFIETEMGKIKGKDLEAEQESEGSKYLSPEDAALQVILYFCRHHCKSCSPSLNDHHSLFF